MSQVKILIATPAHGRQVTLDYMLAIRSLEAAFRSNSISSELAITIGSVLPRSRAALASKVLTDTGFSHLLFVDSDMGFNPEVILKMLRSDRSFCGCIYPSRRLDYMKMHRSSRANNDYALARDRGNNYIGLDGIFSDEAGLAHIDPLGMVRTKRIGLGLTLIHRSVLVTIRDAFPTLMLKRGSDPAYVEMGANYDILQAFEAVQMPSGVFLGEDLSFCHRWTEGCGGEIWAIVDEEIVHIGFNAVTGRVSNCLLREP